MTRLLRSSMPEIRRAVVVHAHPDDETLSSGALLAAWARSGVQVTVVTCTRGERGEVVPGTAHASELSAQRIGEIRAALAVLSGDGVPIAHVFLGSPPARMQGQRPRHYKDSGMRWVKPGVAGPADEADEDSFTRAPRDEATADLVALLAEVRPDVVVGYDAGGTYGHPDHVRAYEITRDAARIAGVQRLEIVSDVASVDQAAGDMRVDDARRHAGAPREGDFVDLPELLPDVTAALECYHTQLTVRDGVIVHVGGQVQEISTHVRLVAAE
ncbi:GlcNAc-PI de-N-acetylase [Actinobaculum sp. 313]|nr:GlcNAc-PI de-N-acetylase [Actinobaculum sp. 313]